jgi:hypothetical protein
MITNNISWSLGLTSNKSFDPVDASIRGPSGQAVPMRPRFFCRPRFSQIYLILSDNYQIASTRFLFAKPSSRIDSVKESRFCPRRFSDKFAGLIPQTDTLSLQKNTLNPSYFATALQLLPFRPSRLFGPQDHQKTRDYRWRLHFIDFSKSANTPFSQNAPSEGTQVADAQTEVRCNQRPTSPLELFIRRKRGGQEIAWRDCRLLSALELRLSGRGVQQDAQLAARRGSNSLAISTCRSSVAECI